MIRRRLTGLLALLLILGLIIGLPILLIALGANPAQWHIPGFNEARDTLTSPDDGTLLLLLVQVVAWIAWAFLTLGILIEAAAATRGIRAPRLPGLRISQGAARGLVGAAALLFVSVPIGAANAAPAAAAPPAATAPAVVNAPTTTPAERAATSHDRVTDQRSAPKTAPRTTEHIVEQGESLWAIAEHHLGDGRRFREIVDLNSDLLNGEPGFLRPGWVLRVPIDDDQRTAFRTVVVEPGDTLTSIAQRELGAADRFGEIFKASRHLPQPGGARLTDPDVIDVGWTLRIPTHPRAQEAARGEVDSAKAPATQHRPVDQKSSESAQNPQPGQSRETPEPQPEPATESPAGTASDVTPARAAEPVTPSAQPQVGAATATAENLTEESAWNARTVSGVGAVLAAGVLTLVATRRRHQQRRRRPGQRMPLPSGRTAEVEQQLQGAADPLSIELVDTALRGLAQHCADTGEPLPAVRAARLTATAFDLYLTAPVALPPPWADTADSTVWTLDVDRTRELDPAGLADVPAPYPALVTIGHDDEDGHVLLDLETLGALAITGDPAATREILAALAIELATSIWADDLQVTVVGVFAEMEDTLQTGRIRYLPTIGRALDDLHRRAVEDRDALAAADTPDLRAARATGAAADAWPPEILLLAGELPDRQRNLLGQLVTELPRVAIAAVTAGDAVGEWALDLNAGDSENAAVLQPIGLHLRPQRVPADQYGHLLEIAALTDTEELLGEPRPEPTLEDVQAIQPVDEQPESEVSMADMPEVTLEALRANAAEFEAATDEPVDSDPSVGAAADSESVPPASTAAASAPTTGEAHVQPIPLPPPRILVLGPVQMLNATGPVEPTKRARLLEYAAYLALNHGATHTAIDEAIWPDRRVEDNLNTRNTATSKLRRWVGKTPDGADYLPSHQAGTGYGFLIEVTTDLDDWEHLLRRDPFNAATGDLETALELVRGAPFEGTHRNRYGWAEPLRQRLIGEIVDASYELGRRRLMEGRWRAAEQALVVGLRLEPAQESLWRLRILAAHESRNPAAEAEAIDRLLAIVEALDCGLERETEQLLQALKNPRAGFDTLITTAL